MKTMARMSLRAIYFVLVLGASSVSALEPASVFSDNMVLQREAPILVWGTGEPGERVSVVLGDQKRKSKADKAGRWRVTFKPRATGGPFELAMTGERGGVTFTNVMIGDLWLCSGQSNMAWQVRDTSGPKPWQGAPPSEIRLLSVERDYSPAPRDDFAKPNPWRLASPQALADFSAVCAYTAEQLHDALDIPIGLVHASWGGSQIEAWIAAKALGSVPGFAADLDLLATYAREPKVAMQRYATRWQQWWQAHTEPWANPVATHWQPVPALTSWRTWQRGDFQDFNGLLWYRNRFRVSEGEAQLKARLDIGGIDEVDLTWVNGQIVGSEFGWGTPRTYELPSGVLKAGDNLLVLNVLSTYGEGGMVGPADEVALRLENGTRVALDEGWEYSRVPASYGYPPQAPWQSINGLAGLYNAMIAPLKGLSFRGVVWYQGESNTGRANQYAQLMTTLVRSWREDFGKDLSFVIVQLPNYGDPATNRAVDSGWAGVRHAQWQSAVDDANTGIAVTIDAGDNADLHPTDKTLVGRRAGRVALALMREKDGITDGIWPAKVRRSQGDFVLSFAPKTEKLIIRDGALRYFELCADTCVRVSARLQTNAIHIPMAQLPEARKIRYCWADGPDCRLYGDSGVPVSSFEIEFRADSP